MKHGFIKVAAVTPEVKVADVAYNGEQIRKGIDEAESLGAKVVVFPELALTGYTCGDLFLQEILLRRTKEELVKIAEHTLGKDLIAFVGLPLEVCGCLYNVAAAIIGGQVQAFIPKSLIPNYSEFYEARHFCKGPEKPEVLTWMGEKTAWFGSNILFVCKEMPNLIIGAEICEDLWAVYSPSTRHALAGATVIVNLSASNATAGKEEYRRNLVNIHASKLMCGYIYASAGEGESTTDLVFSGHNMISEAGSLLAESPRFFPAVTCADLDVDRLVGTRLRTTTFESINDSSYVRIRFSLNMEETKLTRTFAPMPFVPADEEMLKRRCEEIFMIQAMGLKKRLAHTGCKHAVIGISGGLDSTLALLVTAKAFELLNLPADCITAVTMPGFGTTDRTYTNACEMVKKLGAELLEIDIREAVLQHFKDIGHDSSIHDVTYENAQARERTQVLMDIANKNGGMVIGTGDMSELALGWATYNGDHMSMYGVNGSVPKTLVRHVVRCYAEACSNEELRNVLLDVLDTPVSPELLPPEDGEIAQKTEDIVGPYELHDFYMYYILRHNFAPSKVYRLAQTAFEGVYSNEVIFKWLNTFYRRFFAQQFKRSCLPDGPKVGSLALSPRGDLRMPSDACARLWMEELSIIQP